jgi:hypothetical protein
MKHGRAGARIAGWLTNPAFGAGIGRPMRSAVALILGVVASFRPLLVWPLTSNCPQRAGRFPR